MAVLVWFFCACIIAAITLIPYFIALSYYGTADGILHSLPAYEKVIDDTGGIHYEISKNELLRAGELSLGTAESERMKEWRDQITKYNDIVGSYTRYSNVPLLWVLIPRIPDNLEFIEITR